MNATQLSRGTLADLLTDCPIQDLISERSDDRPIDQILRECIERQTVSTVVFFRLNGVLCGLQGVFGDRFNVLVFSNNIDMFYQGLPMEEYGCRLEAADLIELCIDYIRLEAPCSMGMTVQESIEGCAQTVTVTASNHILTVRRALESCDVFMLRGVKYLVTHVGDDFVACIFADRDETQAFLLSDVTTDLSAAVKLVCDGEDKIVQLNFKA